MVTWIILFIIGWLILQCVSEKRQRKWVARFRPHGELFVHFVNDGIATINMVLMHFKRRRIIELEKHDRALTELFHGRES